MPLTDSLIKRAKPKEKPYKLYDEHGLYLIVHNKGGKWWRFKHSIGGREKLLSLGVYDLVTLADAREKRDTARKLLAKGQDPGGARNAAWTRSFVMLSGEPEQSPVVPKREWG